MAFDWPTALAVTAACLAILLPIVSKFAQGRSREALAELGTAIPRLWLIIEQEKRHDVKDGVQGRAKGIGSLATYDPLKRGEQLALERFGKLSAKQRAFVRQELRAHHEQRIQWGLESPLDPAPTTSA